MLLCRVAVQLLTASRETVVVSGEITDVMRYAEPRTEQGY